MYYEFRSNLTIHFHSLSIDEKTKHAYSQKIKAHCTDRLKVLKRVHLDHSMTIT